MSTRASVAIVNADSTVTSIYNHSDGYKGHLGVILRDHYGTMEAAQSLIDQGDASFIGPSLKDCVFYHRDKKEPRSATIGRKFDCVTEWQEKAYHCYMYLFQDGVWWVYQDGRPVEKV